LRERKEDIPGLCEQVLKEFDYSHLPVSKGVLQLIENYPWPGNIRELRNMLERACLLARGQEILPEHFPGLNVRPAAVVQGGGDGVSLVNLDEMEKVHIKKVLEHCGGDKYKASEVLGISLSSLYRKLSKIGDVT
jgi:DNA-binding NtrC family response regulator